MTSCFQVGSSLLAGYVATDIVMGLILFQKNRPVFDQMLQFFKSSEIVLPLVVGTIVGLVTWYVLGEIQPTQI